MPTIPRYYRPPHGVPLYWRDETSGILPAAILAYLDNRLEGKPLAPDQLRLVKEFMMYYINASCWDHPGADPEYSKQLLNLKIKAAMISALDDIGEFIAACLDIGLDPL